MRDARAPFDGASLPAVFRSICFDPVIVPSQIAPVPPGFDEWFARATARDPERRFQSVAEFTAALESVLQQPRDSWVQDTSDGPTTRYTRPSEAATVVEASPVDQPDGARTPAFLHRSRRASMAAATSATSPWCTTRAAGGALLVTRNAYAPTNP